MLKLIYQHLLKTLVGFLVPIIAIREHEYNQTGTSYNYPYPAIHAPRLLHGASSKYSVPCLYGIYISPPWPGGGGGGDVNVIHGYCI